MKKLLMIISAALFMVACGGGECEGKKECSGKDKKECTKGDKKECGKDCKKACCSKDATDEGHGEEGHACEPGCTKACCADKEAADSVVLDGETATVHMENGETHEVEVTEEH